MFYFTRSFIFAALLFCGFTALADSEATMRAMRFDRDNPGTQPPYETSESNEQGEDLCWILTSVDGVTYLLDQCTGKYEVIEPEDATSEDRIDGIKKDTEKIKQDISRLYKQRQGSSYVTNMCRNDYGELLCIFSGGEIHPVGDSCSCRIYIDGSWPSRWITVDGTFRR